MSLSLNKIKNAIAPWSKTKTIIIALLFVILAVVLAGTFYAKYKAEYTVADDLSLNAEFHYVLNKEKMQAALAALTTKPHHLKFVKQDFDTTGLTKVNDNVGDGTIYKVAMYQSADTETVYFIQEGEELDELIYAPQDCSGLFAYGAHMYSSDNSQLYTIDLLALDTSKTTNMVHFCDYNNALTAVYNMGHLDTSNVTDMGGVFWNCYALTDIDLSSFNTSKCTNFQCMFRECHALTNIDISNFDTSKCSYFLCMFYNCTNLKTIDLGAISTETKTDASNMFAGCSTLTTIYSLNDFNIANITSDSSMFAGCTNLVGGAGTTYSVTGKAYAHIDGGTSNPGYFTNGTGCIINTAKMHTALQSLASTSPTTLKFVKGNDSALASCTLKTAEIQEDGSSAIGVYLSSDGKTIYIAPTDGGTKTMYAPADCTDFLSGGTIGTNLGSSLATITLDNLSTAHTTNFTEMFANNPALTSIDTAQLVTANATNLQSMFLGCHALTSIDMNSFSVTNTTNMADMFSDCRALTTLDVTMFDTVNSTNMAGMFNGCTNLTSLNLGYFDTSLVTDMSSMFADCTSLTTIYTSSGGLDLNSLTGENTDLNMFSGCTSLAGGNGTTYDATHVDKTYARVDGGPTSETPGYFTSILEKTYTIDKIKMETLLSTKPAATAATLTFTKGSDSALVGATSLKTSGIQEVGSSKIGAFLSADKTTVYIAPMDGSDNVMYTQENAGGLCGYKYLVSITVSNLDTSKTKNFGSFFACGQAGKALLTTIEGLETLNTSNATSLSAMFFYNFNLKSLDLTSFDTSNVTTMSQMFYRCESLTTVKVSSKFVTTNVLMSDDMFYYCSRLVGGNGTAWNASYTDKTYARIDTTETPGYFTAG